MIEMEKEYRTREGKPVRLYTVNGANASQPIVGERLVYADAWGVSTWDTQGRWAHDGAEHKHDLIEVKPVRVFERWYSMFADGSYITHNTCESASGNWSGRIACLHIRQEYREGDGLSCKELLDN